MAAIGGFIFFGLMSVFFIWGYRYTKKKEEEGEAMIPPSQSTLLITIICIITTVVFFLEMTGLMEPLKAWLQSIE